MDIIGYTYIQHNIVVRPWGIECQYTVSRADGTHINDVVMVSGKKADENELVNLISLRLVEIDHADEEVMLPEKIYTETEVESLLIDKGLILPSQTIDDLLSKEDMLAAEEGIK